ncbi:MAG: hypothetical protein O2V44_05945, partial [Candidatus Bathyarchaeota archaeon]|nr:hypothetical protein [Candidatus Bathyarchaeota archaeon]
GHNTAHSPHRLQEFTSKSIVGFSAKRPSVIFAGSTFMASFGQISAHKPHPLHKFLFRDKR